MAIVMDVPIPVSITDVTQFVESSERMIGVLKIKCTKKTVKNITNGVTKNNSFIF